MFKMFYVKNMTELLAHPNRTILIIDDDLFLLRFMQKALQKVGYNIITANQGKQAIKCLSHQQVDLIIVDLMMPEMDGLVFLKWLRKKNQATTPTLVQTAMVKSDTEQLVRAAGANLLLFKPFKVSELIAKIKELEKLL